MNSQLNYLTEFKDIKKILVIKLRHIGDVLLTVPAIRALRETFPQACITALANSGTEDMLRGNPVINDVLVLDRARHEGSALRKAGYHLSFVKMLKSIGFDMTVDLTGGDRPAIYSFVSGARYRIGLEPNSGFAGKKRLYTHRFDIDKKRHTVLQNLELLDRLGIRTQNLKVDFYTSGADEAWAGAALDENAINNDDVVVHVHPVSRWLFKCWKDEYMAAVIDRIQEDFGAKVIVTCGPDKKEMEKTRRIIGAGRNKPVEFIGSLTLKRMAAISRRADMFFGVDSAPMHIAAAVNTPVVALFGPSGAFNWGPWDNGMWDAGCGILDVKSPYPQKSGIQTFGRHTVIQKDWDCVPCGKDGCAGSKRSDCLDDISVDDVMRIIERYLRRG